jgi:hypothetical protein
MQGSIGEWQRCNYKSPYTHEIKEQRQESYRPWDRRLPQIDLQVVFSLFISHTMTLYSLVDIVRPFID